MSKEGVATRSVRRNFRLARLAEQVRTRSLTILVFDQRQHLSTSRLTTSNSQDAGTHPLSPRYDRSKSQCLTFPTVPEVFPHQAEACPRAEAEPSHPPVDPPEDEQHHQVRHAPSRSTSHAILSILRGQLASVVGNRETCTDRKISGTTPSDDTGARPASVSKRLAFASSVDSRFLLTFLHDDKHYTGTTCAMTAGNERSVFGTMGIIICE